MKQESMISPRADLERVRLQFEQWRKTRERGTKIPERLWAEAVKLADIYPLSQICQSLRVEFNHLKRRVEGHKALPISCPSDERPRFIEMSSPQGMAESECTIEVQRPDGSRMRMSVRGAMDGHLIEMAKAFWNQP